MPYVIYLTSESISVIHLRNLELMDNLNNLKQYEHYKIDEICRICLTMKNDMVMISESGIENVLNCASVQLLEEDKSHFLCLECLEKLNEWYNFNRRIVESFKIGHWLIQQKLEIEKRTCNVKQEMCFLTNISKEDKNQTCIPNLFSNVITKYINEANIISNDENTCKEILEHVENPTPYKISESGLDSNTDIIEDAVDINYKQCYVKLLSEQSIADDRNREQKPYECVKCSKQFKRSQTLTDHMKRHYNSRNFACSVCGKTFYKQFNVVEHMRMHTGERPFKCDLCLKSFTRALLLRNHIKKTHTNEKKYICEICEKSFVDGYQLKIHIRTHTGEKPYQCSECQKTFALQGQLKSHIKYKHTKQKDFICNVCARAFTAKHSLEEHLRTHTGEKKEPKHECSFCGKKCITTTHLKIHVKSQHTGERPFPCQLCDKSFITKSALECHIRTHTGEKTFICGDCGKAFSANSTLRTHLRVHTGERPYECNICCKNFAQISTLNKHMKIHK